jgi:hypothetical protein
MDEDSLLEERMVVARIDAANKERRECAAESKRLRYMAKKYDQKSKRLKSEANVLQEGADATSRLINSLNVERTFQRLRRNDPETTVVDFSTEYRIPQGYGKVLGKALAGNTVVSDLCLHVRRMLPTCSDDFSWIEELLLFLATSSSLRQVDLGNAHWPKVSRHLMDVVLDALTRNSSILKLALNIPVQTAWLQKVTGTTMNLTALTLLFHPYDVAEEDRPTVATCIASLSQLEYLELIMKGYENVLDVVILTELNRANTRLRHLRLHVEAFDVPFCTALSQFTLNSGARLDLVVLGMGLDLGNVFCGLRHVHGDTAVITVFVSQLTLVGCEFSAAESISMAAFLQARIGAGASHSVLNELCFDASSWKRLGASVSHSLADSLLMVMDSDGGTNVVPTVGSQVRSVTLVGAHRLFLDHLGRNADKVRLETLRLDKVSRGSSKSLGMYLPKLHTLTELKLAGVATGGPRWILQGLRQNGTLQSVETMDAEGDSSFDLVQSKLVDAYCERNRILGELLDNNAGWARCPLPSLLQVAKQAPMTRVTNMARGLLKYGDSIEMLPTV